MNTGSKPRLWFRVGMGESRVLVTLKAIWHAEFQQVKLSWYGNRIIGKTSPVACNKVTVGDKGKTSNCEHMLQSFNTLLNMIELAWRQIIYYAYKCQHY